MIKANNTTITPRQAVKATMLTILMDIDVDDVLAMADDREAATARDKEHVRAHIERVKKSLVGGLFKDTARQLKQIGVQL